MALLIPLQCRRVRRWQSRRLRLFQCLAAQQALLDTVVLFPKQWVAECLAFGREGAPAGSAAAMIYGWVTPGPGRLRRRCATGFKISFASARQRPVAVATTLNHGAQVGQVRAVFDRFACPAQNDSGRKGAQPFEPQLLDLAQLVFPRPGGIILVMVVEAEQRKDLVDGVNQLRQGRLSRPSCGRGGPVRECARGSCQRFGVGWIGHGWAPAS